MRSASQPSLALQTLSLERMTVSSTGHALTLPVQNGSCEDSWLSGREDGTLPAEDGGAQTKVFRFLEISA
jgi:hypothetical protein